VHVSATTDHDRIQDPKDMDEQAMFIAVAHKSHNPFTYARAFMLLALASSLDGEILITLFWLRITYHQPMELPDTGRDGYRNPVFTLSVCVGVIVCVSQCLCLSLSAYVSLSVHG